MESLESIGDRFAEKEGYPTLRGREAIHRFLCDRHHWTPEEVRALKDTDLLLLLDGLHKVGATKPPKQKKKRLNQDEIRELRDDRRAQA